VGGGDGDDDVGVGDRRHVRYSGRKALAGEVRDEASRGLLVSSTDGDVGEWADVGDRTGVEPGLMSGAHDDEARGVGPGERVDGHGVDRRGSQRGEVSGGDDDGNGESGGVIEEQDRGAVRCQPVVHVSGPVGADLDTEGEAIDAPEGAGNSIVCCDLGVLPRLRERRTAPAGCDSRPTDTVRRCLPPILATGPPCIRGRSPTGCSSPSLACSWCVPSRAGRSKPRPWRCATKSPC